MAVLRASCRLLLVALVLAELASGELERPQLRRRRRQQEQQEQGERDQNANGPEQEKWWRELASQRQAAIVEQPPSELLFSNQTGALVHCGVAFELAQGLARAAKQQRKLAARTRAGQPGPQADQNQNSPQAPTIQIRWERENGEEIEQILYASPPADQDQEAQQSPFQGEFPSPTAQGGVGGEQAKKLRPNGRPATLRYVRPSDGALVFEPFRALDFRPDVHSATYRCVASVGGPAGALNSALGADALQGGGVSGPASQQFVMQAGAQPSPSGQHGTAAHASLVSRDMRVRAVVAQAPQAYTIEVLDELVLEGNSVTFKCQVPSHASAFLKPVEWVESPSETTFSLQQQQADLGVVDQRQQQQQPYKSAAGQKPPGRQRKQDRARPGRRQKAAKQESRAQQSGNQTLAVLTKMAAQRYFVHPKTGDLTILDVDSSFSYRSYRCRVRNKLTGELLTSMNRGKLIVSESRAPVSPKLSSYPVGGTSSQAYLGVGPLAGRTGGPGLSAALEAAELEAAQQPTSGFNFVQHKEEEQVALLVCHLQAFPRAQISWFRDQPAVGDPNQQQQQPTQRVPLGTIQLQLGDSQQLVQVKLAANQTQPPAKYVQLSNLLLIRHLSRNDSGRYVCLARNAAGEERHVTSLQVTGKLATRLSVSANVLELGKSLALECSISGWPIHQVVFKHNQQIIKTLSGQSPSGSSSSLGSEFGPAPQLVGRVAPPLRAQQQHLFASTNYFVLDDDEDDEAADDEPAEQEAEEGANEIAGGELLKQATDGRLAGDPQSPEEVAASQVMSHVIVVVLEPHHAGAYQCFAHNQFESAQSSAYIRVLDDPPAFRETFRGDIYQPGQDVSLHCSARANPLPEITWTVDEQPIPVVESDSNHRIRFGDFVTRDNLVISYVNISQVQVSDGGLYRCVADNRLARVRHEALVQVWGEPQVKQMPNVTVLASTTFRQRCPVAGHPVSEIQWFHAGHRLPANHRQRVHENGTLEVEHMERSAGDEGEYTCLAIGGGLSTNQQQQQQPGGLDPTSAILTTGSGDPLASSTTAESVLPGGRGPAGPAPRPPGHASSQGSVQVSIRVRPTIEPFGVSRQLREGQRASIMCTISSGDLPISISWFLNDQLLVPISGESALSAAGASPSEQQTQVVVVGPPPSGRSRDSIAAGHPNEGRPVLPGVRISRVSDYSSTLLFESLLSRHTGNYTCLARNDAGSVSHQAPMVVQVAPKWAIEPNDTNIVRGTAASVDCVASGFPPPRVIWTKANGELLGPPVPAKQQPEGLIHSAKSAVEQSGSSGPQVAHNHHLGAWRSIVSSPHLQVFENGSLNVLDARDSDQGHYMCQASNGVGPGLSKVVRVTINVAAQFQTRHSVQYVARGELTHLKCQARGDWPLGLAWLRNKFRLEPVNLQDNFSQHSTSARLGPDQLQLVSSTTASVLQVALRPSAPASGTAGHLSPASIANQLSSWFGASSAGGQLPQDTPPGATITANVHSSPGGLVLPRYSMASSEALLTAGTPTRDGGPATLTVHQQRVKELIQSGQQHSTMMMMVGQMPTSKQALRQQPVVVQVSSVLTIQQVERSDMGTFKCLTSNEFGADERTIQLVVQEPPDRIEELSVLEVQSRSATLGWLAPYDGNAPLTAYHIQYRMRAPVNAGPAYGPSSSSQVAVSGQHHHGHHLHLPSDDQAWLNYTVAATSTLVAPHEPDGAAKSTYGPARAQMVSSSSKVLNRITIGSLRPVSRYLFKLEAENKLGRGAPSSVIETLTLEEAPGASPGKLRAVAQSSSSVLVSWNRLQERDVFGSLHGYYVAYRPLAGEPGKGEQDLIQAQHAPNNSQADQQQQQTPPTSIYKTIQHDDKLNKFDALLTGLKRSTRYAISVQAFNGRGTGPASEPVVVKTLDLDPPRQVRLFVKQATNSSLRLGWTPISQAAAQQQQQVVAGGKEGRVAPTIAAGDVVDHYTLFRAELNEQPRWQETRLPGHASEQLVEQLKCGTRYQFYALAANKIGLSDQSDILDTKTVGAEPRVPDRQSNFDVINATCYVVRLDRWQDGGCPLARVDIRFRLESPPPRGDWIHLAHFDLQEEADEEAAEQQVGAGQAGPANGTSSGRLARSLFRRSMNAATEEDEADFVLDSDSRGQVAAAAADEELAPVDYFAPAGTLDPDESGAIEPLDYMALEAASLTSKAGEPAGGSQPASNYLSQAGANSDAGEANDAQLFSLLKDSMVPSFGGGPAAHEDESLESSPSSLATTSPLMKAAARMPQLAQEWQASNFVLDTSGAGDESSRKAKRIPLVANGAQQADQLAQNWRRVPLCNLQENAFYTVQMRVANRAGETEAEFRLLTSPEGLQYDENTKRHVLRQESDRMAAHSMTTNVNERLAGLASLNQWPGLWLASLAMAIVSILILVALYVKRRNLPGGRPGGGCTGSSPESSTASGSTSANSTNGTCGRRPNGGGGGGAGGYLDGASQLHQPPPSSAGTLSTHRPVYHSHHEQQASNNVNPYQAGRPQYGMTGHHHPGTEFALGGASDNYATVVAGPARHPAGLFANSSQFSENQPAALDHCSAAAAANEITLANIYQQRANQQQTIYVENNLAAAANQLQDEPPYGLMMQGLLSNLNGGPPPTMNSNSDQATTTMTNTTTSNEIQSTSSPSTTTALSSMNSTSTGGGDHPLNHHHHHHHQLNQHMMTLPAAMHHHNHHQEPNSRGMNVYLCTSNNEHEESQAKQQEAAVFYGVPPPPIVDQQQADIYGQQHQENLNQFFASQQQQQNLINQNNQQAIDDQLVFDPVYATIRRTFPQAFKYLTLQHKPNTGQQQQQQRHGRQAQGQPNQAGQEASSFFVSPTVNT